MPLHLLGIPKFALPLTNGQFDLYKNPTDLQICLCSHGPDASLAQTTSQVVKSFLQSRSSIFAGLFMWEQCNAPWHVHKMSAPFQNELLPRISRDFGGVSIATWSSTMVRRKALFTAVLLPATVASQQIGTAVPETHPNFPTYHCTKKGGCVQRETTVVLDEFTRNIHDVNDTSISCGSWAALDTTLCPNAEACAKNCALEGINYAATGVRTDGDALVMNQYVKLPNGTYESAGPRAYLLDVGEKDYELFKMLNMEITVDVDVSKLVCGMNGALYLTEMEATGGRNRLNPAGASYGTGYCDAQCPPLAWINGVVGRYSPCSGRLSKPRGLLTCVHPGKPKRHTWGVLQRDGPPRVQCSCSGHDAPRVQHIGRIFVHQRR